jgi:hypothetical protein
MFPTIRIKLLYAATNRAAAHQKLIRRRLQVDRKRRVESLIGANRGALVNLVFIQPSQKEPLSASSLSTEDLPLC